MSSPSSATHLGKCEGGLPAGDPQQGWVMKVGLKQPFEKRAKKTGAECRGIKPGSLPPFFFLPLVPPSVFPAWQQQETQLRMLFSSSGIQWSRASTPGGIWKNLCQNVIWNGKCPPASPSKSPCHIHELRTNTGSHSAQHVDRIYIC